MCGIVGYTGRQDAKEILLSGLKRLEYRGYDSAGLAIISKERMHLHRCEGKIAKLESKLKNKPLHGNLGVGHTRWATHGRPTEENAHPHTDCFKRLVVVHNGIIENYIQLKRTLQREGHKFRSETDTEIIAHLIEKNLRKSKKKNLLLAVQLAIRQLKGSYAIAVISLDDPEKIVAARQFSPLIIGLSENESFVASDIPAVLEHTRKVISLDDGETAELNKGRVQVYSANRRRITKKPSIIPWDPVTAEKGGFKHFMLKEIFEQPRTVEETFRGRFSLDTGEIFLEESNLRPQEIKNIKKIYFVACGTAYHAGLVGKYFVENLAKIPCEANLASEFRYSKPLLDNETLVIIITQSGETADTLAALREAKSRGAKTLAICNVIGSSATRQADGVIYTRTGPEIGVASTKAFTAQLTLLYILAIHLGKIRRIIRKEKSIELMNELLRIPKLIERILKYSKIVESCAKKYSKKVDFLYLGRNINYPIALEGALKLKEISYIHAEGYAAGEMKHGPIALIDEQMPVMVIATESAVYEKILSNIEEVKARGGIVIALASKGDKKILKSKADEVFYMPKTHEMLYPILNSIELQLFAYYVANFRGCDIDQPRNLAKSVVVE